MIDIITPQRFYQLNYKDDYEGGSVDTIIDLKIITQISLIHKSDSFHNDKILINTTSSQPPAFININENDVATEVYSKLVTAWTAYKLATEN